MLRIKNSAPYLIFCLLMPVVTVAQKDFRETYDTFRYTLYDQPEGSELFSMTNEMGNTIISFLREHKKEILNFRKAELKRYERASIEQPGAFTAMDEEDLDEIRDKILYLNSKNVLAMAKNENDPRAKYEHVSAMLELLSVDPVIMASTASAQVISDVFLNYQNMEMKALTGIYGKIGIGGTYISTEQQDKTGWTITFNNYYLVQQYSVDVATGEMELLTIKTRK